MKRGTPNPSNPVPLTRKRKWKANNVIRIDLGDDTSDEDVSTAVVQQASRDGRRFDRKLHPVTVPRDQLAAVAPHNHAFEAIDLAMEFVSNDGEVASPELPESVVSLGSYAPALPL